MLFHTLSVLSLSLLSVSVSAQYTATYLPSNAPDKSESGQTGTNKCGATSSQDSSCQNAYINEVDDFCLFAPPKPGSGVIGETEQIEVAWCIKSGYGTRLIPDGTITGAHFVKTPKYVQITGVGDLTKLNIPAGDEGGELDPHGADGNGNPIGGLVFGSSYNGTLQQYHEWTNFMAAGQFCFRACLDAPDSPEYCQHIYDVMGCEWNMPGDYTRGSFTTCEGDPTEPMGVYGASTFHQGDGNTPPPHAPGPTSQCRTVSTIANQVAITNFASATGSGSASMSTSTSASASGNGSKGSSSSGVTGTRSGSSSGPSSTGSRSAAMAGGKLGTPGSEVVWAVIATLAATVVGAGALAL